MASRYTGLSAGERSSMAGLAVIVAALTVASLLLARGATLVLHHHPDPLSLFDVILPPPPDVPPPPPVEQVRRTERPRKTRAAPRATRQDPGSSDARIPSDAQASIVAVDAVRPSIIDVGPVSVDQGITAALAAGGPGQGEGAGSGEGNGGSGGNGDQIPYFRAEWIRKPTQEEIDREWPRAVPSPAQQITVLLACEVRQNGHPFHCAIGYQTAPGRTLGSLAIRLAEAALVKPVMHGAKIADPYVIIPFYFQKRTNTKLPAP